CKLNGLQDRARPPLAVLDDPALADDDAFVAFASGPAGRGLLTRKHEFQQFIGEFGSVAEREAFQLSHHSSLNGQASVAARPPKMSQPCSLHRLSTETSVRWDKPYHDDFWPYFIHRSGPHSARLLLDVSLSSVLAVGLVFNAPDEGGAKRSVGRSHGRATKGD